MPTLNRLDSAGATEALPDLITLLRDAVEGGASVGFLASLDRHEALRYWQGVIEEVERGTRLLLVARTAAGLVGAAQLDLAQKPNAQHRAEVMKVLVHRSVRRQGIGQALLAAVEDAARQSGRSLLVLDTRRGDVAEQLYRRHGYLQAGIIPGFARDPDGELRDTVFYYRLL